MSEPARQTATNEELQLTDLVNFLRRNGRLLIACGLAAVVVAAVLVFGFLESVYRAEALLVSSQDAQAGSPYQPLILPAPGYLEQLESPQVIRETRIRAVEAGLFDRDGEHSLRQHLKAQALDPGRGERSSIVLLQLGAWGYSAEQAAGLVRQWGEVFLQLDRTESQRAAMQRLILDLEGAVANIMERQLRLEQRREILNDQLKKVEPRLELLSRLSDFETLRGQGNNSVLSSEAVNPLFTRLTNELSEVQITLDLLAPQLDDVERDLNSAQLTLAALSQDPFYDPLQAYEGGKPTGPVRRALAAPGGVRLVNAATSPQLPEPRRAALKLTLAALAGVMLGLVAAITLEVIRAARSDEDGAEPGQPAE